MIFAAFVSRVFGIPEENQFYPVLRFLVWSNIAIIVMIICQSILEFYMNLLKYGWIKEIYVLLNIIKIREQKTIETHEKVDKTLQKVEEKADKIVEKATLIESKTDVQKSD